MGLKVVVRHEKNDGLYFPHGRQDAGTWELEKQNVNDVTGTKAAQRQRTA
jgi:hypothetical protein